MLPNPTAARVLILDDDAIVARSMARLLTSGCVVAVETDAKAALRRLSRGESFDVITCDVMMPDTSGLQFYEAVVAFDPVLAMRIVFVTGGALSTGAEKFLQGTANTLLMKPFDPARLRGIVARLAARPPALVG